MRCELVQVSISHLRSTARFSSKQENRVSPTRLRVRLDLEHAHEVLEVQVTLHLVSVGFAHCAIAVGLEQRINPLIGLRRQLKVGDFAERR